MTNRNDCCVDDCNFVDYPPLKVFDDPHWLAANPYYVLRDCEKCGKEFKYVGVMDLIPVICDSCYSVVKEELAKQMNSPEVANQKLIYEKNIE